MTLIVTGKNKDLLLWKYTSISAIFINTHTMYMYLLYI